MLGLLLIVGSLRYFILDFTRAAPRLVAGGLLHLPFEGSAPHFVHHSGSAIVVVLFEFRVEVISNEATQSRAV